MKFYRTGEFRPDALERTIEVSHFVEVSNLFDRFNYLLGFVMKHAPESYQEYVENLITRYQGLSNGESRKNPYNIDEMLSNNSHLRENMNLATSVLDYYIWLIKPDRNKKRIEVVNRNYLQSFLHLRYYNLATLVETIGREKAIALYKRFVTHFITDRRNPKRETYDDLEDVLKQALEREKTPTEWAAVRGMIGAGKYAYRNDTCTWVEALKNLPDSELKYYVCCYGDYEGAKKIHDSVILTMEHTIAQGDPYCSRVIHDTRVDWDLTHPSKSFWDSMEPDND